MEHFLECQLLAPVVDREALAGTGLSYRRDRSAEDRITRGAFDRRFGVWLGCIEALKRVLRHGADLRLLLFILGFGGVGHHASKQTAAAMRLCVRVVFMVPSFVCELPFISS